MVVAKTFVLLLYYVKCRTILHTTTPTKLTPENDRMYLISSLHLTHSITVREFKKKMWSHLPWNTTLVAWPGIEISKIRIFPSPVAKWEIVKAGYASSGAAPGPRGAPTRNTSLTYDHITAHSAPLFNDYCCGAATHRLCLVRHKSPSEFLLAFYFDFTSILFCTGKESDAFTVLMFIGFNFILNTSLFIAACITRLWTK